MGSSDKRQSFHILKELIPLSISIVFTIWSPDKSPVYKQDAYNKPAKLHTIKNTLNMKESASAGPEMEKEAARTKGNEE